MDIKRPLEAELLGILCEHKEFVKVVNLRAEDFLDPRNATIFTVLSSLKTDVSPYTLAQAVEASSPGFDLEYLEQVWAQAIELVPSLEDIQRRVEGLREDKLRLDAKTKLKKVVLALDDPRENFQAALDRANAAVMDASREIVGQKSPVGPEIIIRSYNRQVGDRFPSGITGIDNKLTSGGIKTSQVWTLAAQYGAGKSTVAMNIIDNALTLGKSCCYVCLEDTDESFVELLTAVHSGVPMRYVEAAHEHDDANTPDRFKKAIKDAERWITKEVGSRFRVYDASYGVMDHRRINTLIGADRMLHGLDLLCVDFVQAWGASFEAQEEVTQMLQRLSLEHRICVLALSQVSNETIRSGAPSSMLATKGSGALGAASHVGMQLHWQPDSCTLRLDKELLDEINRTGKQHFLGMHAGHPIPGSGQKDGPSELTELGLHLKKARRGKPGRTVLLMDRLSGKIMLEYDRPRVMEDF